MVQSVQIKRMTRATLFKASLLLNVILVSCAAWEPPPAWNLRIKGGEVRIKASQRNEDLSAKEFLLSYMKAECSDNIEAERCRAVVLTRGGAIELRDRRNELEELIRECEQSQ